MGRLRVMAVRLEGEIADLLDSLPNKSEYIRQAILAYDQLPCPLCNGCQVVPIGINEHFAAVLAAHPHPVGRVETDKTGRAGRTV